MAIGIGDMTVTSYVNQPLEANIAVFQPDGLLESEVIASLASPDYFDRLGLECRYSPNLLRFAADLSRASRPVITVMTNDPVALEGAKSRLDSHQASLSGDDAARELASLNEPEVADDEASDDTLDTSLDFEFQEVAKPARGEAEADASGALHATNPAKIALDFALAYIDMRDKAVAADLLQAVLSPGDEAQLEHAQSLLESLQ